jgi:ATP-dependent Clp protease protease subunit
MQFIEPVISTTCTGLAASMGAILLAAGAKGERAALPHSRIMIHQPSGSADGNQSDIEIAANEIKLIKAELYDILAEHTGRTKEEIVKDSDRDYWMRAQEALEYGMIDSVLTKKRS